MKSTRLAMPAIAHALAAALLVGLVAVAASCASEPRGVTNNQPENTLAPGQCLSTGSSCTDSMNCCSQWCANGSCVKQHP